MIFQYRVPMFQMIIISIYPPILCVEIIEYDKFILLEHRNALYSHQSDSKTPLFKTKCCPPICTKIFFLLYVRLIMV